jgi:hypothetical protein
VGTSDRTVSIVAASFGPFGSWSSVRGSHYLLLIDGTVPPGADGNTATHGRSTDRELPRHRWGVATDDR